MKHFFRELLPFLAAILLGGFFILIKPELTHSSKVEPIEMMEGVVLQVIQEEEIQTDIGGQTYQRLEVEITEGEEKGETIFVEQGNVPTVHVPTFDEGDPVLLTKQEIEGKAIYAIADFQRTTPLGIIALVFIVTLLLIGRTKGIRPLLGMLFSFLVVFQFLLPHLLNGLNPILTVILAALVIIPVTFYLSHGVNQKTHLAITSTLLAVLFTGVFAYLSIHLAHISGLASESAQYLRLTSMVSIDFSSLLLAGIIISLIGVLDDVSITQASVIQELQESNPSLSFKELYRRGMHVGRDHISSMVNTLILVYAGSSLPLLLLFMDESQTILEVMNLEMVAIEIIQMLVASTGLILAVPITTALASRIKYRLANATQSH